MNKIIPGGKVNYRESERRWNKYIGFRFDNEPLKKPLSRKNRNKFVIPRVRFFHFSPPSPLSTSTDYRNFRGESLKKKKKRKNDAIRERSQYMLVSHISRVSQGFLGERKVSFAFGRWNERRRNGERKISTLSPPGNSWDKNSDRNSSA